MRKVRPSCHQVSYLSRNIIREVCVHVSVVIVIPIRVILPLCIGLSAGRIISSAYYSYGPFLYDAREIDWRFNRFLYL